jgi:hypothetical protein
MEQVEVKASLDRFEGKYAILYSDDGRTFDIAKTLIPKSARQGARLKLLVLRNDKVVRVSIDKEGEEALKRKIRKKLEKIKRRERLK